MVVMMVALKVVRLVDEMVVSKVANLVVLMVDWLALGMVERWVE